MRKSSQAILVKPAVSQIEPKFGRIQIKFLRSLYGFGKLRCIVQRLLLNSDTECLYIDPKKGDFNKTADLAQRLKKLVLPETESAAMLGQLPSENIGYEAAFQQKYFADHAWFAEREVTPRHFSPKVLARTLLDLFKKYDLRESLRAHLRHELGERYPALSPRQRTEGATPRPAPCIANGSTGPIVACGTARTARALHDAPIVRHALAYPASSVAVLVKRNATAGLGTANLAGTGGDTPTRTVRTGRVAVGIAKAGGGVRRAGG